MKSNFLKLGSMLLCGAMFATVACTDFSEDMNQMAGDVDALEVTLGELQEELDDLKEAQEALKGLVALKEDTEKLEKNLGDLAKDLAGLSADIKKCASKEDVQALDAKIDGAVATATEQITALYGAIEKLATKDELAAAKTELTQKIVDDLAAAKADLEKSIDAVKETAEKALGATETNAAAIEDLKTAVGTLQTTVAGLQTQIDNLGDRITAAEGKIETLEKNYTDLKDVVDEIKAKYVSKADLETALASYVTKEDLAKVQSTLDVVEATLAGVQQLLGTLVGELQERVQSLVFVPEYNDMAISAYHYTLFDESVNETVTVKGTFKVTPASVLAKIADRTLTPYMLAKSLKNAATRADYADGVAGDLVNITNFDEITGTFDVEYVFDAADVEKDAAAIALYLVDEGGVSPLDVDDEMGVGVAADVLENAVSSAYVPVGFSDKTELKGLYRLVKDGKLYPATRDTAPSIVYADVFGWDVVEETAPLEGYEVMLELNLNGNKYNTLEEAAEFLNVDVADIAVKYYDETKYYVGTSLELNAANKNECEVQVVDPSTPSTGDMVVRKYFVDKKPTVETAGNYVNHKVETKGFFYRGDIKKTAGQVDKSLMKVAIDGVDYSYTIDYRTVTLELQEGADRVDWTLDNIYKLSKAGYDLEGTLVGLYENPINKDFDQAFSEYEVVVIENNAADKIDYKAVIENTSATVETTVKANGVTVTSGPTLTITPATSILHDVAAVEVDDYEFSDEETVYEFVQSYKVDDGLWTKVEYQYTLTLGAKPEVINVEATALTIPYSNRAYEADIDFAKLTAAAFNEANASYLSGDKKVSYDAHSDLVSNGAGEETLWASTTPNATKVGLIGADSYLRYHSGTFALGADDMKKIYENERAKSSGYVERIGETWYEVEIVYTVPFTVTEPQYALSILTPYTKLDEDGTRYAPLDYIYAPSATATSGYKYTVDNADIAHYFEVTGVDDKNTVEVEFTIVKPNHGTVALPVICNHGDLNLTSTTFTATVANKGEIPTDTYVIDWGDYQHRSVDLKAELKVNGDVVQTEVLELRATNPLEIAEAYSANVVRKTNDATSYDVLKAIAVTVVGQDTPVYAEGFVDERAYTYKRMASTYGAEFDADWDNTVVYYIENGQEVAVSATWWSNDGNTTISLAKESAPLQTPIYAKVPVTMDYDLDNATPVSTVVTVTFEVPGN